MNDQSENKNIKKSLKIDSIMFTSSKSEKLMSKYRVNDYKTKENENSDELKQDNI